jgi:acetyltransferase EpsM
VPLIAIFGGHASGLLVAESIEAQRAAGADVALAGFLNDDAAVGSRIAGVPVLGPFDGWRLLGEHVRLIAAFPAPGRARERWARLRELGVGDHRWIAVADPRAVISPRAVVAAGAFVAPHAVVEHHATVGSHAVIRAGAYVSHDVALGDFAFVGPNATLLGGSRVGEGAHVGANAVVREGIEVGAYALVGIGAVVAADVSAGAVVVGNPARAR